MCAGGDYEYDHYEERMRVAARDRGNCAECGEPIRRGMKHIKIVYRTDYDDDDNFRHWRVHTHCKRFSEKAAELICNSEVVTWGELGEHLDFAEQIAFAPPFEWDDSPDWNPNHPFLKISDYLDIGVGDIADPEACRKLVIDFQVAEDRYYGIDQQDDYDLGGEG